MTLEGITFDRMRVTPIDDSLLYQALQGDSNRVISDYGAGMLCTSTGLNVYVGKGACLVEGRLIRNTDSYGVNVLANTRGWIVATIDLTKTNTSTGTPGTGDYQAVNNQVRLEAVTTLTQQNLHDGGRIYNFPLYSYVSSGSEVVLTMSSPGMMNPLTLISGLDLTPAPAARTNINASVATPNDPHFESVGNGTVRCISAGYYHTRVLAEMGIGGTANTFRRITADVTRGGTNIAFLSQYAASTYNGGPVIAEGLIQLLPGDIVSLNTNGGAQHTGVTYIRGFVQKI